MPTNKAVVIKNIASLRQKPDYGSELADEVLFGSEVDILEEVGQWLKIQTAYGYQGYLAKQDILEQTDHTWESLDKRFVIASFGDMLLEPKYSANCILTLPRGSRIAITGNQKESWTEVYAPNGEKGWMRAEALLEPCILVGNALRQSIVDTALLYMGTQYRWGGKTPMGIDCSGLSSMAYALNGITIPRDSGDQMDYMKKVDRKDSRPGDLLFFSGHVAIYIGEDKFVHATGSGATVRINSLNKDSKLYRKDLDEKYLCTGTVF